MIASGLGWPDHGRFCQRDLPLKQDSSQNVTYFVHFILLRYFGPNFLSTYSNSTNLPQSRLLLLLLDLDEWAGFSTSPPVKKKKKKHMKVAYLIIVIFLHWHNFWRIKFTPKKRVNYDKIHRKLPIFCVITAKYTVNCQFFALNL